MTKNTEQSNPKNVLNTLSAIDTFYSLEVKEIDDFIFFLNEEKYRVADTNLSYRQINSFDSGSILKNSRANKKGWRQFSLKELIYLSIVRELRIYGLKNEQVKGLRDVFFEKENKHLSDVAIGMVFMGINITLLIGSEDNIGFYDFMGMEILVNKKYKSFININLNEVVGEVLEKLGKEKIGYKNYKDLVAGTLKDYSINEKELEVVKIIRNKEYTEIIVRKRGDSGDDYLLTASGNRDLTEEEIVQMLKERRYGEIVITQRGKIVNSKSTDTFKI